MRHLTILDYTLKNGLKGQISAQGFLPQLRERKQIIMPCPEEARALKKNEAKSVSEGLVREGFPEEVNLAQRTEMIRREPCKHLGKEQSRQREK